MLTTFILDAINWFNSRTFNILPIHEQHILHYQFSAREPVIPKKVSILYVFIFAS